MSEKHQECSECGKPLAHRVHSPTYGTHAYREPVASPQATRPTPLGTCDYDRHRFGVNKPTPHIELQDCINWRAAQPAAGTTPPNHELIARLYSLVGEHEEGCSALKSTIIGGLGCTCNGVRHITHGDAQKCLAGDHSECESFPSEGTTPQAERLTMHNTFKCKCGRDIVVLGEIVDIGVPNEPTRAVAPVDTLGKCEFSAIPHTKNGGRHGHCKWWTPLSTQIAVETRLTAEQLDTMVRDFCAVGPRPKSEVRRRIREFAEAFRDKSEAGLREEIERLQHEFCNRVHTELDASERARTAEAEAAALREALQQIGNAVGAPSTGYASIAYQLREFETVRMNVSKLIVKALSAAPERP